MWNLALFFKLCIVILLKFWFEYSNDFYPKIPPKISFLSSFPFILKIVLTWYSHLFVKEWLPWALGCGLFFKSLQKQKFGCSSEFKWRKKKNFKIWARWISKGIKNYFQWSIQNFIIFQPTLKLLASFASELN